MPQPALQTERLRLRPFTPADADHVLALAGEWSVARMLGDMPHPLSRERVAVWLRPDGDGIALGIERDGALVGGVSWFRSAPGTAELGFWLGRPWWGRGYAAEAASAVIAQGFRRHRLDAFTARHQIDNPMSGRVLAGLGFEATGRCTAWCEARQSEVEVLAWRLERRAAPADEAPAGSSLAHVWRRFAGRAVPLRI